jgi:4-alpha-glucanotransferase
MGWYLALSAEQQHAMREYFHASNETIKAAIIHKIMNYKAEYVVLPVQDIIGLDESARFNAPGTIGSPNWEWKLANFDQVSAEVDFIASEVTNSGRA